MPRQRLPKFSLAMMVLSIGVPRMRLKLNENFERSLHGQVFLCFGKAKTNSCASKFYAWRLCTTMIPTHRVPYSFQEQVSLHSKAKEEQLRSLKYSLKGKNPCPDNLFLMV